MPVKVLIRTLKRALSVLRRDTSAADLIEYALVIAIIALGIMVAISRLGCQTDCIYQQVALSIEKGRENIPPGQMRHCMDTCRQD